MYSNSFRIFEWPSITVFESASDQERDRPGIRSYLAWSTGPHTCPAKSVAYLVVQDAIDQLLDALPEMQLAVPADKLVWWPDPFHRAMAASLVVLSQSPPLTLA